MFLTDPRVSCTFCRPANLDSLSRYYGRWTRQKYPNTVDYLDLFPVVAVLSALVLISAVRFGAAAVVTRRGGYGVLPSVKMACA